MKSQRALPPQTPRLPDPEGVDLTDADQLRKYLATFASAIASHLQQRPMAGTSQPSRMFTAPDGKVWAVSVDETGNFVSEPIGSTNQKVVPPA
jgi:hypothetical protein